jgi:hypothetical protein
MASVARPAVQAINQSNVQDRNRRRIVGRIRNAPRPDSQKKAGLIQNSPWSANRALT